jgi:hypothetical protein
MIIWHCMAQSDQGGGTILADAIAVVADLPRDQQDALTRVQLKEHSVFDGDEERHPLLWGRTAASESTTPTGWPRKVLAMPSARLSRRSPAPSSRSRR